MTLTIAIPTFNRENYLKRNLQAILDQYSSSMPLDIIVSDNASTDNTRDVVSWFIQHGLPIQYILNENNLGYDQNTLQCFERSNSKYILVLGDDDMLMIGSIEKILNILSNNEVGILYLVGSSFEDSNYHNLPSELLLTYYRNPISFLNKIHYYSTFISSNIVNLQYFSRESSLNEVGSLLVQMPTYIDAIFQAKLNIVVNTPVLKVQEFNAGGYGLFTVFGINLVKIFRKYSVKYNNDAIESIIRNEILLNFFPTWITYFKKNKDTAKFERADYSALDLFYRGFLFYKIVMAINKIPDFLVKPYLIFIKTLRNSIKIINYVRYNN